MVTKVSKPLKGMHPASPEAAEAILMLVELRERQHAMKKTAALLVDTIIANGCGAAYGYRTYTRTEAGSIAYRRVVRKQRTVLKLIAFKPAEGSG